MKEMIKKYKGTLICSVLVMLAGILVGFTMAQSIWINVFFVVTDCILVTIIFYDNRNRQQSSKVIGMVIWMIPVTALIYNGMARLISMDADSENLFMAVIYFGTGLLFMIIGNYLPKVKQNNTIGISSKCVSLSCFSQFCDTLLFNFIIFCCFFQLFFTHVFNFSSS